MTAPDFAAGVRAQPEALRRSAAAVRDALAGPTGTAVLDALRGGRIAAIGMGASTSAVAGFAAVLRAAGRPAVGLSAADLAGGVPDGLADVYLALSQSGRSRETVEALHAVPAGVPKIALTNDPDQPLAAVADLTIPLGHGEDSRVSTLSYTASLQALGLIADALGADGGPPPGGTAPDWEGLPAQAEIVLAAGGEAIADAFAPVDVIDVVGSGLRAASVGAAALLLREAVHLPTAAYLTREYLHGPLEVAGAGRGALVFGDKGSREAKLAADLAGYGASVVLVTSGWTSGRGHPDLRVVTLPAASGLAAAVLDILPVQDAAAALAARRGITIGLHHMPDDTKLGPPAAI